MMRTCKTCRYFRDTFSNKFDEVVGNCCRRAPFPVLYRQTKKELEDFSGGSHWPVVLETNWCGEHENNVDINPSSP